jgi:hypothetical protein
MVASVTSLRRYKARQIFDRYHALPTKMRTRQRAEPLLQAIIDYAFEHVQGPAGLLKRPHSVADQDLRLVTSKLHEFIPADARTNPEAILDWVNRHAILRNWASSDALVGFFQDCVTQPDAGSDAG